MERDVTVDPGPVPGVAVAPFRENTPGGMAPVQHPVAHVAGCCLHAGGTEHLPHRYRVFAVLIPAVNGSDLVRHVDYDMERDRRGFRRRLRITRSLKSTGEINAALENTPKYGSICSRL